MDSCWHAPQSAVAPSRAQGHREEGENWITLATPWPRSPISSGWSPSSLPNTHSAAITRTSHQQHGPASPSWALTHCHPNSAAPNPLIRGYRAAPLRGPTSLLCPAHITTFRSQVLASLYISSGSLPPRGSPPGPTLSDHCLIMQLLPGSCPSPPTGSSGMPLLLHGCSQDCRAPKAEWRMTDAEQGGYLYAFLETGRGSNLKKMMHMGPQGWLCSHGITWSAGKGKNELSKWQTTELPPQTSNAPWPGIEPPLQCPRTSLGKGEPDARHRDARWHHTIISLNPHTRQHWLDCLLTPAMLASPGHTSWGWQVRTGGEQQQIQEP